MADAYYILMASVVMNGWFGTLIMEAPVAFNSEYACVVAGAMYRTRYADIAPHIRAYTECHKRNE
jgi:hypothetical protein